MANALPPSVVIAGGGPAGLVAAILLSRRGVPATILEKSPKIDEWSTKSYSIVLGERGLKALERAGALEAAKEKGMARRCIIFHDAEGRTKVIPKKNDESLGFSRPLLVECLEDVARKEPNVTIRKGAAAKSVSKAESTMQVELDDGTTVTATHIIGADGKWSKVRSSIPELDRRATIRTEPSWGVHIMRSSVPKGWRTDGTHVIKPTEGSKFHIIAAPIPTGEMSMSMVCYDQTLDKYPWLEPPGVMEASEYGKGSWEDEYSARPEAEGPDVDLTEKLGALFGEVLPSFLLDIGVESLGTARINRRTTWLEMAPSRNDEGKAGDTEHCTNYSTEDGLVALIGDAAHAVVPTMGEGCNMAMESAVSLVDSIHSKEGEAPPTVDDLSEAFSAYGRTRAMETQPIQEKSAALSRHVRG